MTVLEPGGTLMYRSLVPARTPDPVAARSNTFSWVLVPVSTRLRCAGAGFQTTVSPVVVGRAPNAALSVVSAPLIVPKAGNALPAEGDCKFGIRQGPDEQYPEGRWALFEPP
jgi:hypothetical protein